MTKDNSNRWRCLISGCNPVLDENSASAHREETGHRVAKWPTRSSEGVELARKRNRSGYYNRYNRGEELRTQKGEDAANARAHEVVFGNEEGADDSENASLKSAKNFMMSYRGHSSGYEVHPFSSEGLGQD